MYVEIYINIKNLHVVIPVYRYRALYTFQDGSYVLQKSIRKYRFFGHAHVTGIEILYIFHSSQKLLPTHFAAV
jgi:hypothetical protein